MSYRRSTSAETAARFRAMRGEADPQPVVRPARKVRARRSIRGMDHVPPEWRFVEKRKPGVFAEWRRDVGLPWDSYRLAESGREPIIHAMADDCRAASGLRCESCYQHRDGSWQRVHLPVGQNSKPSPVRRLKVDG